MSPQNPELLYLLALGAIPVILHFLLRAKPKKLIFPALRLIQQKRRANRRRMRLRHLLLLLLRIAVIALLVLALARLAIPATDYTPNVTEIVTALGIVAVGLACYWRVLRGWQQRDIPAYVLAQKKSYLRSGLVTAGLVLILLTVAWPFQRRIAAAISQPTIQQAERLPAAAVFLFDNSLSMDYRQQNKTRLDLAREIATEHLSNLPSQSRVAICDTSLNEPVRFSPDRSIAQRQIQELEVQPVGLPLNERVRAVVDLQVEDAQTSRRASGRDGEEGDDPYLRELYIFTDFSVHAWQPSAARMLQNDLERLPSLGVYLIDTGDEQPKNAGISGLKLSSQSISRGGEVMIEGTVSATGSEAGQKTVELSIIGAEGEQIRQGSSDFTVEATAAAQARFPLSGLTGPVAQGELRLVDSDPLPFDDVVYFTIEVQPPLEVLIVSDDYASKALFWKQALSPDEFEQRGQSPYRCKVIDSSDFRNENLSPYSVVCWLDVAAPEFSDWRALQRFLQGGGGAVLFLGEDIQLANYVHDITSKILPAELLIARKFDPFQRLDLQNMTHPLLKPFQEYTGELSSESIFRYWRTKSAADAKVIASYTDERADPAVLERAVGQGRVLMVTTPFDRSGWNDLVTSYAVPVIFADQAVQYLSQQTSARFNYTAGQVPVVKLPEETAIKQLLIRKPDKTQPSRDVPVGAEEILIDDARLLGHYRLLPRDPKISFEAGFSINAPDRESDLTRLTPDDLNMLLGEGRYEAARDIDNLTRQVRKGRVGREIFPFLVALMIGIFVAEHLVANYFYDNEQHPVEDEGSRAGSPTADRPAA